MVSTMDGTVDVIKKLEENLAEAGIGYWIQAIDYDYSQIPRGADIEADYRGIRLIQNDGDFKPPQTLQLPPYQMILSVQSIGIDNFLGAEPVLTIDLRERKMVLDVSNLNFYERSNEANHLRQQLETVAKNLNYKLK